MVIAVLLLKYKPSLLHVALALVAIPLSVLSAARTGGRVLLATMPILAFLVINLRQSKRNNLLLLIAIGVSLAVMVGWVLILRNPTANDPTLAVSHLILGDFARNHTLSYIIKHTGVAGSDLLTVPILPSYLYWAILAIPRAIWFEKPYTAVVQFNFEYSYDVSGMSRPMQAIFSGQQFGFIDETLMNAGVLGFGIVFAWGSWRQGLITAINIPY